MDYKNAIPECSSRAWELVRELWVTPEFRMKLLQKVQVGLMTLFPVFAVTGAERFVSPSGGHVAPFSDWLTAATNIQSAIDAAASGDIVTVTNGVYFTGGKVKAGDLTNRIAIDKPILVRSVNGPSVTTVQGAGAANGTAAVRGAWLTNGAVLEGFTISGGATRTVGDGITLRSGGGIWCVSTDATVTNCIIRSNTASLYGSATYQGTLKNGYVISNTVTPISNGAVANGDLINCTVVSNLCFGVVQVLGGVSRVTNSIVYYNPLNYSGGTFAFSCSTPLPTGAGNISSDPQLQSDGVRLSSSSPCRGAGVNVGGVADLLGQPWSNPPSIGCAEWLVTPSFEKQPVLILTNNPGGFAIRFTPSGQEPFGYYWFHDGNLVSDDSRLSGASTTNLVARKFMATDVGLYWVVVSNAFGMATSQVAQVVAHFVNNASTAPTPPYISWFTAATNIQDAIDAAQTGEFVLVSNGVYSTGGKVKSGSLLNRVAIDKPVTLIGVNGYRNTIIEGAWDPISTNGPSAVRGVWMTNGATLVGFTVRRGATRGGNGLTFDEHCGGGIWATSTMPAVLNCLITNNAARWVGGGVYYGTFINCILTGNTVDALGAPAGGGAAGYANLRNCTVSGNRSARNSSGGGTIFGSVRNSIVINNFSGFGLVNVDNFYSIGGGVDYAYTCTDPLPSGTGNIVAYPAFLDEVFHLPAQSPCRGVGSAAFASGEDMDSEAWANSPSMGADEVIEANLVGPIQFTINSTRTNTLPGLYHSLYFWDSIVGRVSRIDWNFGDGVVLTNTAFYANHWWTNPGTYTVTSTAFNNDYPSGVSASVVIQVFPLVQPELQSPLLDGGSFKFSFNLQTNAQYAVQYTTNLASPVWQTLQNFFPHPGGPVTVMDPAWTNAARFYRVLMR